MNAGFSFSNGVAVEELRTGGTSAFREVRGHAFPEKNSNLGSLRRILMHSEGQVVIN